MTDNYSENQEQLTDQFKKMFEGKNSMEKWARLGSSWTTGKTLLMGFW